MLIANLHRYEQFVQLPMIMVSLLFIRLEEYQTGIRLKKTAKFDT